eukprot:TRINITY_DN707_c1_g3_i1.p1 TRINITY_DN707_c1_g3~~TRINITY_DN707_c1_g3_i1.p1  ORF type:complete len:320 (+),score=23.84 TRINITY_DN707_c1_g3_i1:44-961(+)
MESGSESTASNESQGAAVMLKKLKRDEIKIAVVGLNGGWGTEEVLDCLDAAGKAGRLTELVVVDIITDDIVAAACYAVRQNPGIKAFGLGMTTAGERNQLTLKGMSEICALLEDVATVEHLFITSLLQAMIDEGLEMLSHAIFRSNLHQLSLEGNGIHDGAFLHLARCLAAQNTIKVLHLKNNLLSYEGLEMLAEVMGFNRSLVSVNLDGNYVSQPTDTWEGFTIYEQCRVNDEMVRNGPYTYRLHCIWPLLFRKKIARLWFVWSKVTKYGIPLDLWETMIHYIDPRGYVNQKVRLWMNNNRVTN